MPPQDKVLTFTPVTSWSVSDGIRQLIEQELQVVTGLAPGRVAQIADQAAHRVYDCIKGIQITQPPMVPDCDVIDRMISEGGHFVAALGRAAQRADLDNLRRIKQSFANVWREYAQRVVDAKALSERKG